MNDLGVQAQRAHRASVSMSIADVASFLQDAFGQKLVAYMARVSDHKAVGRWAHGDRSPHAAAADRLRCAYQIFQLLQAEESPHTVRAWFVGLNPQLDDESPATTIREGAFKDALVAARAFLTGG
ncbi:MAG: XRE family transcriptional regulator [Actinobacteria bacterium]|nr:XRE family transcriptional regulator [Actinomycetota bacterium]